MTAPGSGFGVDPEQLLAHADEVAAANDRLKVAIPGECVLSDDAYGVVGRFFAAGVSEQTTRSLRALDDVRRHREVAVERLRLCASEYVRADQAAVIALDMTS
jgi:hypothetical protein